MINIELDNEGYLDLPPDLKLQVAASNAAFDSDSVGRVFSYPLKVPASPRNLAALRHINRMDARRDVITKYRPGRLWLEGSVFERGDITMISASQADLEIAFGKLAGRFLDDLSKIKIRDLMPVIEIPQTEQAQWVIQLNLLSSEFEMTINGNYFTASGFDTDAAGESLRDQINASYTGVASYEDGAYILTLDVDASVYNEFNVRLEPSGFPNPGLSLISHRTVGYAQAKNLTDYIAAVQDSPVAEIDFPTVYAGKFYADKNTTYTGYINYRYGATIGQNQAYTSQQHEFNFIPFVRVKYVLDQIADAVGIGAWGGDTYDGDDFAALLIWNTLCLDVYHEDYNTDLEYTEYINAGPTSITLANHVPDLTALEFVKRICAGLNSYMEQRGNNIFLRRRRGQLNQPAADYSARIGVVYRKIFVEEKAFYLTFQDDKNELDSISDQLLPYPETTGERIELPFKPMYEGRIGNAVAGTDTWLLCKWLATGSSVPYSLNTEYGFRLFFGRGEQLTADGETYLMSTVGNLSTSGPVIGEYGLQLEGDAGLFATFFDGWQELNYATVIELEALLDVAELSRLLEWDNPIIRFIHPDGDIRAMVKAIDCSASMTGIGMAKLTLLKI